VSYLDLPRIHLFGTFFANPSTINNLTPNFNPATPYTSQALGWDPSGQALFKVDVAVRTVLDAGGAPVTGNDALVGATLVSIPSPNHGKIVDLDPDQQNLSQVFGLTVQLLAADGKTVLFTGKAAACALTDLWGRTVGGQPQSIATAGGMYQTVIQVEWGDVSGSPVLQALRHQAGSTLSIKWNVDGFDGRLSDPGFGYGRMSATLGPAYAGEPQHVLGARRLGLPADATPQNPMLWFAPFKVDAARRVLVLDLGNSVATTATLGGPFSMGPISVSVDAYGNASPVGQVEYSMESYQARAGVFELPLGSDAQLDAVRTLPLEIAGDGPDQVTYRLVEAKDGVWVGADLSFLRLNPGESAPVDFYATRFGVPCGVPVDLAFSPQSGIAPDGSTISLGNDPAGGLSWSPAQPVTDPATGKVTVTFTGGSTAPRAAWRQDNQIDGQVYYVSGSWSPAMLDAMGSVPVTALVFDAWAPKTSPPTWWGDIQPIMYQYARLYPGMRQILDISDYDSLQQNLMPGTTGAELVLQAMRLPIDHPNHMPVTRDLSAAKVDAYEAWVRAGCPLGTAPSAEPAEAAEAHTAPPFADEVVTATSEPAFGPGSNSIKARL
jgi:hypothetical protein